MKEKPKELIRFDRIGITICSILTIVTLVMLILRMAIQSVKVFTHDTLTETSKYLVLHFSLIACIWALFIWIRDLYKSEAI